ncbi:MAG: 4Fe-4S binding protein [Syntrophobacteria bacterium]
MRVFTRKRESAESVQLTLQLYTDSLTLRIDKEACIKCNICQTVCPKEAIRVEVFDEALDITIDPDLCVLCELCSYFCPVSCIELTYNQSPKKILLDQKALPVFPEKITVDTKKCPQPCAQVAERESRWCRRERQWIDNLQETCPKHCQTCLENCPREAFSVEDGVIQVEENLCLRCSLCMDGCEYGAILVRPVFGGSVRIDDSKCPEDCMLCIDWCPTKCIVREGKRVYVQRDRCAFCGTCVNICPEGAIELTRHHVYGQEETFSEAWSTAVAKLTGNHQR